MGELTTLGRLVDSGSLSMGDGYRTKRPEHGVPGFRILRVADIEDGNIRARGGDFVRQEFSRAIGSKLSEPGDVLLTTKGTVGRVAIVGPEAERVVYSPQLCYFRIRDKAVVVGRFLAYWFKSKAFSDQASHRANNTDMAAYINLADLRSVRIDLPDVKKQQAVAEVLGALDDKITANDRVVAAADALARALYEGASSRREAPLSSLARFINGKAFTKGATGAGRVVVRIAELNSGIGNSTVFNEIEVSDDHLARPGDLLFSWSGSLTAARWFRPEAIVNQHIFKVVPFDEVPMWLVNQAVHAKLADFRATAANKATTMGHIQRSHLDESVSIPKPLEIGRMHESMSSLWSCALTREIENLQLVATRDQLLPLLMSGRLRVKDAERVVEEVV